MPDLLKKTSPEPRQVYSDTDVTEIVENASLFLDQAVQYQELMMMYDCAIKEVRTKLEVLNSEFSVRYQRNPIEFISSRIKKPVSIVRKMRQRGLPLTFSSLEQNLNDVAGIRVICSFIDDIYAVADMLIRQDDVTLLEKKDYIKSPKENGYRSLHLIVEIPVFFSDHKRDMKVEVQIRTISNIKNPSRMKKKSSKSCGNAPIPSLPPTPECFRSGTGFTLPPTGKPPKKTIRSYAMKKFKSPSDTDSPQKMKGADMPTDDELYYLAELFKIFGDQTRIKILYTLLDGEMCVQDIADSIGMSQSSVSHQLRVLKQSQLVKFRRDGRTIYYALADQHVCTIMNQGLEHIQE